MHGTMMIAGQTTGTPSVVNPRGRCSFDIIHGTDLGALAALDTHILVDSKLLIRDHPFVEVTADDVGVESGSGSLFQFLDASATFLNHLDDMWQLLRRQLYLHGFLLLSVGLHKGQADVTLRHNHGKLCLSLQRLTVGSI